MLYGLRGQANANKGASLSSSCSDRASADSIQVTIDTPHPTKIVEQTINVWLAKE